jgi:RES domain-containing protein
MHEIHVPDGAVLTLQKKQWPEQWNSVPQLPETQTLGDRWIAEARHAALKVPSVHSRSDWNVLINPEHEAARRIKVARRWAYTFDARLFGAGKAKEYKKASLIRLG